MKKFSIFFVFLIFSSIQVLAQKQDKLTFDEIHMLLSPKNDTLFIKILDPTVKDFDLFIYLSVEDVKVNTNIKGNSCAINIGDWKRGLYHIKIDYNYITQFRNFEIYE